MCWSQQLFDAMIHVYNRGLNDYTTPLLELLLQLRAVVKRGKSIPGMYPSIHVTFNPYGVVSMHCTLAN